MQAFAALRGVIGGSTTEKGLREYLVLLSICETCKRRGISFLNFLISGESSVELFAANGSGHSKKNPRQEQANTSFSKADISDGRAEASAMECSGSPAGSPDQSIVHNDQESEREAWRQFIIPSDSNQTAYVVPTLSRLERFEGVPTGGTMVALPALNKNGYWEHVAELFPTPIDKHFQEIALTLIAVLHLSRFPSIEALQFVAPEEWRKIFCQERLPSSRTLGEIIRLIGKNAGRVVAWKAALATRWIEETPSFGAASFTGGTSLEFIADRFQSYQCDNVTLDRLCEDMASSSKGKSEPGRWPVNGCERSEKSLSVATVYAHGGEIANRTEKGKLTRGVRRRFWHCRLSQRY